MRKLLWNYVLLGASAFCGCGPGVERTRQAVEQWPAAERNATWVQAGAERLQIHTYMSRPAARRPALVVVLHGDAPFSRPGYQYELARRVAAGLDSVVAVGLLRPGYTDPDGRRSTGVRGEATGDNYTPAVVDAVAAAVGQLRAAHRAGRVVLVGHSGGAAIAADVLGRHPGLAAAAVLVSCPCDVPRWREHMHRQQPLVGLWQQPVASISPADVVGTVPAGTAVHLLVGTADDVTPPALSQNYARQLREHGVAAVHLQLVPGQGHELLLDPAVLASIRAALQ